MKTNDAVRSLTAIAHESRLSIFRVLVVAGESGLTPGDLMQKLETPAATLSFHLKELMHAGMIEQERQGRNLIYRANYAAMNSLLSYLTENCCQGQSCLPQTGKGKSMC